MWRIVRPRDRPDGWWEWNLEYVWDRDQKLQARCRADGCVDLTDFQGEQMHICDLDEFIARMLLLRERAVEDFRGTAGEERWFDAAEAEKRRQQSAQFSADLLQRYPDTWQRVFGK
jgi:hypothetical protein